MWLRSQMRPPFMEVPSGLILLGFCNIPSFRNSSLKSYCNEILTPVHTSWTYSTYFFEISRKLATRNSDLFMLLHWYCHRGFCCGKMITFTLKILNIFGDVCTRDGTSSHCQRDASAQIVMSHNNSTQILESIPFTPSFVIKWHDRHRYLPIHNVPYLMSPSSPPHCSKTSTQISLTLVYTKNITQFPDRNAILHRWTNGILRDLCWKGISEAYLILQQPRGCPHIPGVSPIHHSFIQQMDVHHNRIPSD